MVTRKPLQSKAIENLLLYDSSSSDSSSEITVTRTLFFCVWKAWLATSCWALWETVSERDSNLKCWIPPKTKICSLN